MSQPGDPYRPFDDAALAQLAALVRTHRQAVLATADPDGHPYVAMVAYAAEPGLASFLVHLSDLAAHKGHLRQDPRVGLLLFEPDNGRTEIVQHRRLSLQCLAEVVVRGTDDEARAGAVYLGRFPSHRMMFDLGDFDLVRLVPTRGLLNAGFGRAYAVTPKVLAAASRVDARPLPEK